MENYYLSRTVPLAFEAARQAIVDALAREGFGVLTEIDVKATLKKKLDVEMRDYTILGACNPPFANEALKLEPQVGILLPCNVVVQADDDSGQTVISVINPTVAMEVAANEKLVPLATAVKEKLASALKAV